MISNTNNKKLITKSILDIKLNKYQNVNEEQEEQHQLFYLSDYRYGGCTTFTAHLLHLIKIKSVIVCQMHLKRYRRFWLWNLLPKKIDSIS